MTELERRARELLDQADTRGEVKRLAELLEQDDELRAAVLAAGRARGADLPDDALDWPARKLLRRARARDAEAQRRTNPIRRDESFTCVHCGHDVGPLRRTDRDHCPRCLRSLHVDVVPGDRANACGGVLDPVGVEIRGKDTVLRYRCRRCGATHRVRAVLDGPDADEWEAVVAVSAQQEGG